MKRLFMLIVAIGLLATWSMEGQIIRGGAVYRMAKIYPKRDNGFTAGLSVGYPMVGELSLGYKINPQWSVALKLGGIPGETIKDRDIPQSTLKKIHKELCRNNSDWVGSVYNNDNEGTYRSPVDFQLYTEVRYNFYDNLLNGKLNFFAGINLGYSLYDDYDIVYAQIYPTSEQSYQYPAYLVWSTNRKGMLFAPLAGASYALTNNGYLDINFRYLIWRFGVKDFVRNSIWFGYLAASIGYTYVF